MEHTSVGSHHFDRVKASQCLNRSKRAPIKKEGNKPGFDDSRICESFDVTRLSRPSIFTTVRHDCLTSSAEDGEVP